MVTARRKEREKEQRRKEIIEAAEKLFFEKGFEGVSMDDVAREAELAKGTLYLYFKNKDALFFAVVARGISIMNTMMKEGIRKGKNGAEKLYSTGESYYGFYKQYPEYFELLSYSQSPCFTGKGEGAREAAMLGQEIITMMHECIVLGQADGSIRKDMDPVKTTLYLVLASEGIINRSAQLKETIGSLGISQDEFVAYALEIMGSGVTNEGWGRRE